MQSTFVNRFWLVMGCTLLACQTLHAQAAIGEVFASDASVHGSVILSGNGTRVLSGSQVSAGDAVALLKLERGGEVRICPKTNLSLSADAGGKTLVVGMNAGAMEVDYPLQSGSDSLLTPDFRLQLISPGSFHFAISVSGSGDTYLRTLPGNDAAVFVAEMMGAESYQLTPGKSVLFKAGKISGAMEAPKNCGCPEVKAAPQTEAEPVKTLPEAETPASKTAEARTEAAPEAHMEVESTFVYSGKNAGPPDLSGTVARLSSSTNNSALALALMPKVSGPAGAVAAPKQEKTSGVFHRFGKFLGRVFGK
jgi:hypothetical protein